MSALSRSSGKSGSSGFPFLKVSKYDKLLNSRNDFRLDCVAFSNMHQHLDTEIIQSLEAVKGIKKKPAVLPGLRETNHFQ